MANESEFGERSRLIISMLDKIYPFKPEMSADDRERVEHERQSLAMRSGWSSLPIEDLRRLAQPQVEHKGTIAQVLGKENDYLADV